MNLKILLYSQGFIVIIIFTAAVLIWRNINNENPTLYKCRHAINFILMITLVLVIKGLSILPDPGNIRILFQHALTAIISFGFFIEAKKVYKKSFLRRKKELEQVVNLDVENPIKEEINREIIKPELKKLDKLKKDIFDENQKLNRRKEKLEKWNDKLSDLKYELKGEKENLLQLKRDLDFKQKEIKSLEESLDKKEKTVGKKEADYGKKEQKLKQKRNELKEIKQHIKEERDDIDRKIKTMDLLEKDIKDKKNDLKRRERLIGGMKK